MDIKQFAQNVHNEAVKHGWWENGERNFGELKYRELGTVEELNKASYDATL